MTAAQVIDGVALSKQLRQQISDRVSQLKTQGVTPGLAVILVGDNPASQVMYAIKSKPAKTRALSRF